MPITSRSTVLAFTILALGACAPRATQEPAVTGAPLILEVHNAMPHPMNISYEIGGAVTALGQVNADQTKRWELPNQGGDEVTLFATDEGKTHRVDTTMDLDHDQVNRWEIK